ncbi:PREDICTED: A.superbus venom factor 2-like [Condylura cristata]|uniref:A.superbus venom factor 2-like n=1 Tax=Condylura cristata TaxID=143302 RepID=UPI0003346CD9|nr:PREDICTED: A.superbus venom factor 2-like [Condylura cristata]
MPMRTLFPESWLWRQFTLPKSNPGSATSDISHYYTQMNLPDSITTWQIVAVSLKAGQGLCVSEPFELTVMKTFFMDLKLPSSVIRNEQIQIQAVLYNFRNQKAKVRVEFPHKESLCSASKSEVPWRQAGGEILKISDSTLLNPQGNTQTLLVRRQDFFNKVPDTEAEVFVSIQGYTQMLTHRNEDGTYNTIKGSPGNTWLTSYVLRIFFLAYQNIAVTAVNLDSLCAMASWIITQRQAGNGHFLDVGLPIMSSMQGGYTGSEADVSLTAHVLIALDEGKELCIQKIPDLTASMERARGFLERRLPNIQTTFAIAIVSYALALTNSPRANDRLDSFASHGGCGALLNHLSLYTIEATAYALMQKLKLHRHNETHAIAKWLVEKRKLGGGFDSTQTTVVAIEALTRFSEAVPFEGTQDLHVQISVPKRDLNYEWDIDQNNAYQLRSAKFFAQDDLEIKASGNGRGTISVLTVYHKSLESWEDTCNLFTLNVTLHAQKENKIEEETFWLQMKTRFKDDREATMSIMEVSMLTGFYPNQNDLKQLTDNVEMYAFQYETKTSSSDSTVVLYLEKVSHKEDTVLGFRVHRMLQADFLQAAQVTIYDYYEPCEQGSGADGESLKGTWSSRRCSAFYNLPKEQPSLRKICHSEVCRCAEEQCPSLRKDSSTIKKSELQVEACETGVDFVYKVKLEEVETSASNPYIYYNMQLQAIIKSGTDSALPLTRKKFVSHTNCYDALGLQEQETYLIMGQASSLWRIKSDYKYVLDKKTFLMRWPDDGDVGNKELLDQLEEFSEYMRSHGCQS